MSAGYGKHIYRDRRHCVVWLCQIWATNIKSFKMLASLYEFRVSFLLVLMEANSAKPGSLNALVHSPILSSTAPLMKNLIVKITLKIWAQFKRFFGLQSFSIYAPIASNHVFSPSLSDSGFLFWSRCGINTFHGLYIDGTFASFQQLREKFSLPNQHFFRYLQICSFARVTFSNFPLLPK